LPPNGKIINSSDGFLNQAYKRLGGQVKPQEHLSELLSVFLGMKIHRSIYKIRPVP